ncbi:MAG: Holliday junction branch migration protein RuvA [Prevotella sp.]|nr:Holliday junction branch migration protein RuvA [Prevotella sp.]
MIDYIKGELAALTPAAAVVECCGIGYLLNISLNTYTALQGQKDVKLFVDEQLVTGGRDDGLTLYGFFTRQERELYRMLLSVNGIGANTARTMLSALTPAELFNAITGEDLRLLKSAKGVGPKAAQRIILELKDKLLNSSLAAELQGANRPAETVAEANREVRDEAVSALTMLGFSPAPTAKVVIEILRNEPDLAVEEVVKKALKMM